MLSDLTHKRAMSTIDLRLTLRRLGSAPPIVLGLLYVFCFCAIVLADLFIGKTWLGAGFVRILLSTLFALLFVIVTWFRKDDWLAAGVLIALILYSSIAAPMLAPSIFRNGIGPAAITGSMTLYGAILWAVIFAPIMGATVALARKLTPQSDRLLADSL